MSDTNNVPILKIQIDDSEFAAFKETFDKYRSAAAGMAGAWAETDAKVAGIQKRFDELRKEAERRRDADKEIRDRENAIRDRAASAMFVWSGLLDTTHRVVVGVGHATLDLIKWTRLTAVFSGLIGAGGLFGLNTLAAAAAAKRFNSSGAGVSIGEYSAVQTDFSRLGDTDAMLRGFVEAETDKRKLQPLVSLGINPQGKNAAQLLAEALPRIKDILDHADPTNLVATMRPYNLEQLGITEGMQRLLRRMKPAELQELEARIPGDIQSMQIADDIARKWQDFISHVQAAELKIEAVIARNLIHIEPGLSELSKLAVNIFDTLTQKGGKLDIWLENANLALLYISNSLASGDAQTKTSHFLKAINRTFDDIRAINKWFTGHHGVLKFLFTEYAAYSAGRFAGGPGGGLAAALGTAFWQTVAPTATQSQEEDDAVGGRRAVPGGPRNLLEEQRGPQEPAGPPLPGSDDPSSLDPKSRSELSGVNKELAENLLAASKESGIRFRVTEGLRTQDEANQNAARGTGVSDSQHLYGAAVDLKVIDPDTGQPTRDRAVYERFAQAFNDINRKRGTHQRWLGDSIGPWRRDIVHFDQGLGYGQTHRRDPFGTGPEKAAPTLPEKPAPVAPLPRESPAPPPRAQTPGPKGAHAEAVSLMRQYDTPKDREPIPLLHPNARKAPAHSVVVHDNTGAQIQVAH